MGNLVKEFWREKRVFVTGHTGFKGSWLVAWLDHLGASVSGFSLDPPSDPYLFQEAKLAELCETSYGDVSDFESLSAALRRVQPDVVIHLAAQPIVRESYRHPLATLQSNIMGTASLLEAVRGVDSIQASLIVTSDKCYEGAPPAAGHGAGDRLGGDDPYSVSKAAAELVTTSWRRSFEDLPPIASARAGNVIGGGDWGADRLIPDAVRAVRAGTKLQLRSPDAVRPWQHVLDVLNGYLLLIERMVAEPNQFSRGWNFAPPPKTVTVGSLVQRFYSHLEKGTVDAELMSDQGMNEKSILLIDPSESHDLLNWRAKLAIESAIRWTSDWYAGWLEDRSRARELLTTQIEMYEQLEDRV